MIDKIESFMNRFTARSQTKPVRDAKTQEVVEKSAEARDLSRQAIEEAYRQADFAFAKVKNKGH